MMDELARRVLHGFKHGESVQQYQGEFSFIFITLLRTKNAEIRVKFVCDVDGKYGKKYWIFVLVPKSAWYGAQRVIKCLLLAKFLRTLRTFIHSYITIIAWNKKYFRNIPKPKIIFVNCCIVVCVIDFCVFLVKSV